MPPQRIPALYKVVNLFFKNHNYKKLLLERKGRKQMIHHHKHFIHIDQHEICKVVGENRIPQEALYNN